MERGNTKVVSILGFGTGLLAFSIAIFILMATLFGLRRQSNDWIGLMESPLLRETTEYRLGDTVWTVQAGQWVLQSGTLKSKTHPAAISLDLSQRAGIDLVAFVLADGLNQPGITISFGERQLESYYQFTHLDNGRLSVCQVDSQYETPFELAWVQTDLSPLDQNRYGLRLDNGQIIILVDGEKYIQIEDPGQIPMDSLWVLVENSPVAIRSID